MQRNRQNLLLVDVNFLQRVVKFITDNKNMIMNIRNIFFFVTFLSIVACHDDLESTSSEGTETPSPEIINEIQDDVIGYVYNESGNPIAGAEVSIYKWSRQ